MIWLLRVLWRLGRRLPKNLTSKLRLAWFYKFLPSIFFQKQNVAHLYDFELSYLPNRKVKMCLDLSVYNQRRLYMSGVHERDVTTLFTKILDDGMTVVDVGAYIGYYTAIAAIIVGNCGRVLSFEPASGNFKQISKTIKANQFSNVKLYQLAISDKIGEEYLRLSTDPASHSIANATNTDFFKGSMKQTGEIVSINATTLDQIFEEEKICNADLVKIDVEGAELRVLKGMHTALQTIENIHIICDVHENKFSAFGYSVQEFYRFFENYQLNIFLIQDNRLQKMNYESNKLLSDQYTIYVEKRKDKK